MLVNPYDDRKVSLRRPHGNGDLDIVGTLYTRRKANVKPQLHCHDFGHDGATTHPDISSRDASA